MADPWRANSGLDRTTIGWALLNLSTWMIGEGGRRGRHVASKRTRQFKATRRVRAALRKRRSPLSLSWARLSAQTGLSGWRNAS
eukprot:6187931-Pleurochrysis_carterae.AAC.1